MTSIISPFKKKFKSDNTYLKPIKKKFKAESNINPVHESQNFLDFGISYLKFCISIYKLSRFELEKPINKFSFLSLGRSWLKEVDGNPENALDLIQKCLLDCFRVLKFKCKVF